MRLFFILVDIFVVKVFFYINFYFLDVNFVFSYVYVICVFLMLVKIEWFLGNSLFSYEILVNGILYRMICVGIF